MKSINIKKPTGGIKTQVKSSSNSPPVKKASNPLK
jgi:hypothetical protein